MLSRYIEKLCLVTTVHQKQGLARVYFRPKLDIRDQYGLDQRWQNFMGQHAIFLNKYVYDF